MYATYLKQEPNYFNTLMVIIYLNLYQISSLPLFLMQKIFCSDVVLIFDIFDSSSMESGWGMWWGEVGESSRREGKGNWDFMQNKKDCSKSNIK